MNHNQNQQSSEGRHDDDEASLSEFLASLMDYTPTVSTQLADQFHDLQIPINSDR